MLSLIFETNSAVMFQRLSQIFFFCVSVHRLSAIGSPAKFITASYVSKFCTAATLSTYSTSFPSNSFALAISIDRDQIDAVLGHGGEPGPQQLTTIAALFSRYADFPGAEDIRDDLQKCLTLWGLSRNELNLKTREIWESGWRLGHENVAEGVGSGADVEDAEA